MKENHEELSDEKRSDVEVAVGNENEMVASNECKAVECCEDEGDCEKEHKEVARASSQLVKDSKGNIERAHVMREKLQEGSTCAEVARRALVGNLKDELYRVACGSQDEHHLEVEDTKNKPDSEFHLSIREECFKRREKKVEAKKVEALMSKKERGKE